ncbi:MAG: 30S ribosomal protein S6 [Patescibacteria group bacterium]
MKSEYEIAVVFDPQLSVDLDKATNKVDQIFKTASAKVVNIDNWGKKNLAYKIGQHSEGIYVFYNIEVEGSQVGKIESTLNITDEVIRYLVVKVDHKKAEKIEKLKEIKKSKMPAVASEKKES